MFNHILFFLTFFIIPVFAQQTVTVHFRMNTCAVPDTLSKRSVVQVRGSVAPLTWLGSSPVFLTNPGSNDEWGSSDYWVGSAVFPADTVIQYKMYTNHHDTVYAGCAWEHEGWEANLNDPTGNRILDLSGFTGTDTVLDLQFVNGWQQNVGQYEPPFTTNDSTFVVYFRVNVEGFKQYGFNPILHKLGIRGSNTDDWGQTGEISWNSTYLLSPEPDHANGGSQQYDGDNFYSGAVHVPNQYLDDGIQWKFVVHYLYSPLDDDWSNLFWNPTLEENIQFSHTSWADTTFYWRWYDRITPSYVPALDSIKITFKCDMTNAINTNGFNHNDSIFVISGLNLTASQDYRSKVLQREGFTNYYSIVDTIGSVLGINLEYTYYIIKHNSEYREIFYDYYESGNSPSSETRKVTLTSYNVTTIDDEISITSIHRQPKFLNTDTLFQPITVIYTCDLRPAYYRVLAGDTLVDIGGPRYVYNTDSLFAWGVHINGPATGGWQVWGQQLDDDTTRLMFDDGTHGDEIAGDTIYSRTYSYTTNSIIGQVFKFGIHGGDNEEGIGNLHYENIDQSGDTTFIRSQFGSIDPLAYEPYWDFLNQQPVTAINESQPQQPWEFLLAQNYPNPFNPVTTIEYSLPVNGKVNLEIFNVLGEKVKTLVNKNQTSGNYSIQWNGRNSSGNVVSSGVYFYRLKTDNFIKNRKMILLQ